MPNQTKETMDELYTRLENGYLEKINSEEKSRVLGEQIKQEQHILRTAEFNMNGFQKDDPWGYQDEFAKGVDALVEHFHEKHGGKVNSFNVL